MRTLLCTLALTAVCGVAQALTASWTNVANNVSGAGSTDSKMDLYANTSATLAASITYGASIGTGTVLSIGRAAGSNVFSVTIDNSGKYVLSVNGVTAGTSVSGSDVTAIAGETQIVALSFYRSKGEKMDTVQLSVDGVVVTTLTDYGITSGPMKWTEWGRDVGNKNAYTREATYDVWLTQGSGDSALLAAEDIKKDIEALPEPTALALLALGVAGLALRRKVA